jgi:hypothetical protein
MGVAIEICVKYPRGPLESERRGLAWCMVS